MDREQTKSYSNNHSEDKDIIRLKKTVIRKNPFYLSYSTCCVFLLLLFYRGCQSCRKSYSVAQDVCLHTLRRMWSHASSGHLRMWSEWWNCKCVLSASRLHLYLELSTCDRITQDTCRCQMWTASKSSSEDKTGEKEKYCRFLIFFTCQVLSGRSWGAPLILSYSSGNQTFNSHRESSGT